MPLPHALMLPGRANVTQKIQGSIFDALKEINQHGGGFRVEIKVLGCIYRSPILSRETHSPGLFFFFFAAVRFSAFQEIPASLLFIWLYIDTNRKISG